MCAQTALLLMGIQGYMPTTVTIACVAWGAGLVTGMDTYGVVVDRLKNIANAQETRKSKRHMKDKDIPVTPGQCRSTQNDIILQNKASTRFMQGELHKQEKTRNCRVQTWKCNLY